MMITVLDILLLALAVAAIWKLRSVFGRRTGYEQPAESKSNGGITPDVKQAQLPQKLLKALAQKEDITNDMIDDSAKKALADIGRADKNFTPQSFLRGARIAYRFIIEAFAAGDMEKLKTLVKQNVAMRFQAEMERRADKQHDASAKVIKITGSRITAAAIDNGEARITVEMKSDQITWTKDEEGRIISGDPNTPREMKDIWTFSRKTSADKIADPNWLLMATSAGA